MGPRVYPAGIPTQAEDTDASLWPLLSVIHFHSAGEWSHSGAHLAGLHTPMYFFLSHLAIVDIS